MAKFALCTLLVVLAVVGGQASPTTRVVGGEDAVEGQFPHQVSLRRNSSHTCGGSIISRNFILTAAHCVGTTNSDGVYQAYDPSVFDVRVGTTLRLSGGYVFKVAEIITHEDYGNFLNDVALCRLAEPLFYSSNIQPIALATSEVPAGQPVVISGWGRIKNNGDLPMTLQYNTLTAISRAECKARIGMDSDTLICLLHDVDNGACNGDSGGPAMYNGRVVGIAGFVYGGCGSSYPDGYAKVYYHFDWIKKHCTDC